jgi:dimethylargininase
MFKQTIVRLPGPEMIRGLSSASLGKPDLGKALDQHEAYVKTLQSCGLEVRVLEADARFPDGCFVEDVALCTPVCAIVTNPGAPSRNAEKLLMEPLLREYYGQVESITAPGTLDAGDVMMVGKHYFIGISERTNQEGADQLIRILGLHGMSGSKIPLHTMLHLKSGVSYLENNQLLVSGEFVGHPAFAGFEQMVVETDESYAANSLWVNSRVLVPAGFPKTLELIKRAGYDTTVLDMSEFRKLDGGLSCLSLRF